MTRHDFSLGRSEFARSMIRQATSWSATRFLGYEHGYQTVAAASYEDALEKARGLIADQRGGTRGALIYAITNGQGTLAATVEKNGAVRMVPEMEGL